MVSGRADETSMFRQIIHFADIPDSPCRITAAQTRIEGEIRRYGFFPIFEIRAVEDERCTGGEYLAGPLEQTLRCRPWADVDHIDA